MTAKLLAWFDTAQIDAASHASASQVDGSPAAALDAPDWTRIIPLLVLHVAALAALFTPVSTTDVAVCVGLYYLRLFAITGFYHRYFAHKAFRAGRVSQCVFAILGASATQRGPLWWAAVHRRHHRHADTDADPHNARRGFWWSHLAWFLSRRHFRTDLDAVPDLARFPELRWLDRYDTVVPILLGTTLFAVGEALAPRLDTNGWQLLLWGYVVSTVALLHTTVAINSLSHRIGRRAYETRDTSRNSTLLALLTLGEGWHNNHHRYCGSARQGFEWWQVDFTYYGLWCLNRLGFIRDLKPVPAHIRAERTGFRGERAR